LVTAFLVKYFGDVVDYNFTAEVETEFDEIEEGKKTWNRMIAEFYKPFHKTVEEADDISRKEASGARTLGNDPKTGKPIIARLGRFGPMLQLGDAEQEDEKPKFAPLPEGVSLTEITLEEALPMFSLPRRVGTTVDGQEITADIGRFGPYVKVGEQFVSIKPEDPFTITQAKARELITVKQKADAAKHIAEFADGAIKVLNGRFGPYVTDGTKNAKIPKGTDPHKIDEKAARALLEAAPVRFRRKTRSA
jgi:DNA topoisomerase-1